AEGNMDRQRPERRWKGDPTRRRREHRGPVRPRKSTVRRACHGATKTSPEPTQYPEATGLTGPPRPRHRPAAATARGGVGLYDAGAGAIVSAARVSRGNRWALPPNRRRSTGNTISADTSDASIPSVSMRPSP